MAQLGAPVWRPALQTDLEFSRSFALSLRPLRGLRETQKEPRYPEISFGNRSNRARCSQRAGVRLGKFSSTHSNRRPAR